MTWVIAITVWVVCGVAAYGMTLAYFQSAYPTLRDRGDVGVALVMGLSGPLGLLNLALQRVFEDGYHFYGFQFLLKPPERTTLR